MIIEAINKGDPLEARQAVYNHLDSALSLLVQNETDER
jgi:DNA-binding GntR family transcriptional regulator